MTFLNLKYPILQAPMGGVAATRLAANVSNSGGMGSLALTWDTADAAVRKVRSLKSKTDNPFFVNYVLSFPPDSLDLALEAGAPAVSFSWGQPGPLVGRVHEFGAQVGVQVGTVDGAKQALDSHADFIICQGVEAGGHVQSTTPLADLLEQVIHISGSVPVVVAGGLANGRDLHWALQHGAAAIMLGTRFVATEESSAHPLYKQAIVDATAGDSVYTLCFDGGWPYAAHRVLRNDTLNSWESAGCPPVGQRPNEHETVASGERGDVLKRYDDAPPTEGMQGSILDACLYAGTGCGSIEDIPDVPTLMSRIWAEYQAVASGDG